MKRIFMWGALLMLCAVCLLQTQQAARSVCIEDCYSMHLDNDPNHVSSVVIDSGGLEATGYFKLFRDWNPAFDGDIDVEVLWYIKVEWWSPYSTEVAIAETLFEERHYTTRAANGTAISETATFVELLWLEMPEWAEGIKVTIRLDATLDDEEKPRVNCEEIMPADGISGYDLNTEAWQP